MVSIYPSLISAPLLKLQEIIDFLDPYCDGFHLDVMDFHFVPNLTWGPQFINEIRKNTQKKLQVHLMVEYPEQYLDRFELAKDDIVSVHIESPSKLPFEKLLAHIRSRNLIASIALNPFTPLEAIISVKSAIQHVLLMSVNPGFSGQEFLPHTIEKLKALNNFRAAHNLDFFICVDGGINGKIAPELIKNGAQELAIASAIFNSKNPVETIKNIKANSCK